MSNRHRRRWLWIVAATVVLTAGCGSDGGGDDAATTPTPTPTAIVATPSRTATVVVPTTAGTPAALPALRLDEVASGLDEPLYVTAPPGDPSRLFVVEQTGRIRVVTGAVLRGAPFLDLSSAVSCCGERGLLGLAFHPDYAVNGRFFVNYTDVDGDTVVAEFMRGADPEVADPAPRRVLFTVEQPFANHNGGMLAFGPDGLLYVGLGDGGGEGDPFGNAQRLDTKLGKILRIDVDTHPTPPSGNVGGGDPDVWDFGLRNPWRFSFDRATGDLYIGDVGQDSFEEIDVEPRGQGGRNYGWNVTEGLHCFRAASCDTAGITLPVTEYDHGSGDCSVTGGYVYRGAAIPELSGRYLYGDFCSNRVRSFVWDGAAATDARELTADLETDVLGAITSFGEDAAGEVLIVDRRGAIFRIVRE